MSSEGLYTLTEETEKIVEGMKDDIEIYYVVQEGSEDKTCPSTSISVT